MVPFGMCGGFKCQFLNLLFTAIYSNPTDLVESAVPPMTRRWKLRTFTNLPSLLILLKILPQSPRYESASCGSRQQHKQQSDTGFWCITTRLPRVQKHSVKRGRGIFAKVSPSYFAWPQKVQPTLLEFFLKLGKRTILGVLDSVTEECTHSRNQS